jgi:hypothetical protein
MTTGAVILAFNNEETDYVAMAAWSARNIQRHLGIPTSIITDCRDVDQLVDFDVVISADAQTGGKRYFDDYAKTVTWHNAGRTDVYNLTPYDQTIVLDADYVVASDDLKRILHVPQDFMCHKTAVDLTTGAPLDNLNRFGDYNFPMWWATVIMFRKSNTAQYIFDCMTTVKNNWQHYRDLYGIRQANYRNDFALSIALGIVSGHTLKVNEIPWPLYSVLPSTTLSGVYEDSYILQYNDAQNKPKQMTFSGLDFHAMGKKHLEDIIANPC